jgi:hypothetical protein
MTEPADLANKEGRMMAEDATPLVEALLAIIDAARAYLPPDGRVHHPGARGGRQSAKYRRSRRSWCHPVAT